MFHHVSWSHGSTHSHTSIKPCPCRCSLDTDRRVDSLRPNGVAVKQSVGLGDEASVLGALLTRNISWLVIILSDLMRAFPSAQLVRIGSVSLEEKSLAETRSELTKQSRPLELTFHRRGNELRHIIRLTLRKKNPKLTPNVGMRVRASARRLRVRGSGRVSVGV